MHDVNVLGPLMVSLSNHARSSLRQACPEEASRLLRQAQDERTIVQFLFHYLGACPANPLLCGSTSLTTGFDGLSTNGKMSIFSMPIPLTLSLSKVERGFAGQAPKNSDSKLSLRTK